ncbi:transporter substrate-binding domain-containing protein [Pseudomonas sp. CAN2814]|uniref:substrate-binding periplasmic protein n=1 Tax=Pseudomonas sp. CAN1 TaxID=3046726 RepID=UPI002648ABED|nr:transporter substrate-binding domain-containing protein [Pseudomonas sp. CAN1]MDN6859425.1 transporter substrate-binding domain-containing protein [Pseudomonas sp. CAN1]
MKPSILSAALLCTLLGSLLSPWAWAGDYRLVTEEWAPYNYVENNQLTGMATDIVKAIMQRTGDDFAIELLPSMRTSRALQSQSKTIMFSMFRTAEREPLYKWVGPIVEESIHPYQLANSPRWLNTLAELHAASRITTRHAGLLPDVLQAQGFDNLDKRATGSPQLYLMLLAGRTEIIAGDTDAGVAYYSRQLGLAPGTLRQIPVELYRSSLYIAFSRDSDDGKVAAWNRALEQLRESGELARIQQQYEHPRVQ